MTGKQFELEVLNDYEYVIAEFDKDNYYLDDENSAKSLECRLNELFEENEQLKEQREKLFLRERDTKNRWRKLKQENEQLKKENYELHKRLGDFKPFEEHIQERTSVNDIIGLVKTDEPTNSVELKKELYK